MVAHGQCGHGRVLEKTTTEGTHAHLQPIRGNLFFFPKAPVTQQLESKAIVIQRFTL
jgi:hypothetical protein